MNATATTATTAAPVVEAAPRSSRYRKALLPLGTLAVAGAVAIGSGATFTSTTGNTISAVTSGTLSHTNSKDGAAVFNLGNVKPGDTLTGSLSLKNTGSLDADFGLTETTSSNGFDADYLTLVITNTTTGAVVHSGTFGDLTDGVRTDLGVIAAGATNDFRFTVSLDADAPNSQQGRTASAAYSWDSVQLAAEQTNQ